MNRSEIINQIKDLRKRKLDMDKDLERLAVELSAPSQVAIITKMVILQEQIEEFKAMLDFISFEEITKNF